MATLQTRSVANPCQVLSFPVNVAPIKVLIVSISNDPKLTEIVYELTRKLRKLGIASRVDDSSVSIGKKYARNDELGTPFGITVDFASKCCYWDFAAGIILGFVGPVCGS